MRFETLAVHAGYTIDPTTGAIAPPIHLATTFARDEGLALLGRDNYARESNPTQSQLEAALAPLEGGAVALALASGMAAGAALLQAIEPGGRILLPDDAYYGFHLIGRDFLARWGLTSQTVAMENLDALREALLADAAGPVRLVWLESPSNPLLKVVDLAAACRLAKQAGALTVVDNTFATPVLQRPLALGADVVLHSTTKYFGGHSDVMGGALVFARNDRMADLVERVRHVRHVLGAVASPFASWLVLRGLRTLAVRVAAQSRTAQAVAEGLARHPAVAAVHYPGLPTHPGHAIAARQMSSFGGMLSFQTGGGRSAALRAVGRCRLFTRATSLGSVESLIEHRATSEGKNARSPEDLVRLSIGLEHPDDLLADLEQALAG